MYSLKIRKGYPKSPFTKKPIGEYNDYVKLGEEAAEYRSEEISNIENKYNIRINKEWLDQLAMKTQVVKKYSKLDYNHGRLLYTILSNYIKNYKERESNYISIFETGTARGFSSICMSKAMKDNNISGNIITIDCISHTEEMFWNCISDFTGAKTRSKLLKDWFEYTRCITYIQGWSKDIIKQLNLQRINFAFLDGSHKKKDVLLEYQFIKKSQQSGDIIIFDDVTPNIFEEIVEVVERIELENDYTVTRIKSSEKRGYAIAYKN